MSLLTTEHPLLLFILTLILGLLTSIAVQSGMFSRKNHFPLSGRCAIVTGGSQGLGLSIARLLASKGAHVLIVAQDIVKLERAVQDLKSQASSPQTQRFQHLSFDLRDPSSAPRTLADATRWNGGTPPDILVCCAGNCVPSFFAQASLDTLRSQMDTIYWSAAYMAHAMLNAWLEESSSTDKKTSTQTKKDARHIVFACSTLAFYPFAGYAPYSPAKAAMKSLADTLQQEIAVYNSAPSSPAPIKVSTLYPMGILTPGYENETLLKPNLTKQFEKGDKPQTPEEVARICVEGLERGQTNITTAFTGHVMRGLGMASNVRQGVLDVVWWVFGGVGILFAGPDFIAQCRRWGREKGMPEGAR